MSQTTFFSFQGTGNFTGLSMFSDLLQLSPDQRSMILNCTAPLDGSGVQNLENPVILGVDLQQFSHFLQTDILPKINARLGEEGVELISENDLLSAYRRKCHAGQIYNRKGITLAVNINIKSKQEAMNIYHEGASFASYTSRQYRNEMLQYVKSGGAPEHSKIKEPTDPDHRCRMKMLKVAENLVLPCYQKQNGASLRMLLPFEDIYPVVCLSAYVCPEGVDLTQYIRECLKMFHCGEHIFNAANPIVPFGSSRSGLEAVTRAAPSAPIQVDKEALRQQIDQGLQLARQEGYERGAHAALEVGYERGEKVGYERGANDAAAVSFSQQRHLASFVSEEKEKSTQQVLEHQRQMQQDMLSQLMDPIKASIQANENVSNNAITSNKETVRDMMKTLVEVKDGVEQCKTNTQSILDTPALSRTGMGDRRASYDIAENYSTNASPIQRRQLDTDTDDGNVHTVLESSSDEDSFVHIDSVYNRKPATKKAPRKSKSRVHFAAPDSEEDADVVLNGKKDEGVSGDSKTVTVVIPSDGFRSLPLEYSEVEVGGKTLVRITIPSDGFRSLPLVYEDSKGKVASTLADVESTDGKAASSEEKPSAKTKTSAQGPNRRYSTRSSKQQGK